MKADTIKERIAVLETLMTNHLHHHEIWLKGFIIPLLVLAIGNLAGVCVLIFKVFIVHA